MKKLVLTTLAACVSMAFASAYAETTTSKEPIRLAQAPKGVDDSSPSGASPDATRQRPKRAPKEGAKRSDGTPRVKSPTGVDDATPSGASPTATKQRPKREPKPTSARVKDPKSVDESTPSGALPSGPTTRSKDMPK